MTKFKKCFDEMVTANKELFDRFTEIHNQYLQDPKGVQEKYNEVGREVQDVVRRYENILCGHSEGSGYGKYSANLAEKFQQEIKKNFPKYDFIGVER
jgi:hypothetical protein